MKMGKRLLDSTGVKELGNASQISIDYCSLCNHLFSKNLQLKYNISRCDKISASQNLYEFQIQLKRPAEIQFSRVFAKFRI